MSRDGYRARTIKSLLLLILCMLSTSGVAGEKEMRRILVGLKLFPAVVAADYMLVDKKNAQGMLPLYVLHENNQRLALRLGERLSSVNKVKNIPIEVSVLSFDEFIRNENLSNVAVFMAEPPDDKFDNIVDKAISSSILLFSPFKGDVEKGVHSGIIVSDRILPYVNVKTMQKSRIRLKAFFLRVSEQYD